MRTINCRITRKVSLSIIKKTNKIKSIVTVFKRMQWRPPCLCASVLNAFVILMILNSGTYSQSIINYQSGTIIEVQTGASVCADNVKMSGTFKGAGTICGLSYMLNLTALIQGFYNPVTDLMVSDTVRVYLRNSISPYPVVDSSIALLDLSGNGFYSFNNIINGVNYYISIKHRNSIETWSKTTPTFTDNMLTYNFDNAATQAYGDNMIQIDNTPLRFGIYSGDVNQNGSIDAVDLIVTDNDVFNFVSGYVNTDVTGDNVVDAADLGIIDNNAFNYVSKITPP